jgi:hypothetical protein
MGCHSFDTQVLTPEGIKDWKKIKIGDKVYGADKDLNLKEATVKEIFKYKYQGQMIRFYNNNCYDLLVTPNHTMAFRKYGKKEYEYLPAAELLHTVGFILSTFNSLNGEEKLGWKPESQRIQKHRIEDFLQIVAWYITEGNIVRNR